MHYKNNVLSGFLVLALSFITLLSPYSVFARQNTPALKSKTAQPVANGNKFLVATGTASYYGSKFHGRTTANGEQFDMRTFTAAHRSLPFGTIVRVTNLNNGKMVFVTINDRGPYVGKRIIDLSKAAAKQLDMVDAGISRVKIEAYN